MVFGVLRPDPGGKVRWGAPTAPDKDEPTSCFSNRKTERKGGSGGVPNRGASGTGEGETLLHGTQIKRISQCAPSLSVNVEL